MNVTLLPKKQLTIYSLGVFEKTETSCPFAESDNDIKKGRVYTAKNADDLIKKCLK